MSPATVVIQSANQRLVSDQEVLERIPTLSQTEATALANLVSTIAMGFTRRVFVRETVRDTYRVPVPSDLLVLTRTPVSRIVSVTADGVTLESTQYEVDSTRGFMWRLENDRRVKWAAVKTVVEYDGGYQITEIPADVKEACLLLAVARNSAATRDAAVKSETFPNVYSVSFHGGKDSSALPPDIERMLARYVRYPV